VTLEAPAQAELRPTSAGGFPRKRTQDVTPTKQSFNPNRILGDAGNSTGNFMWAHAIGQGDAGSPGSGGASLPAPGAFRVNAPKT
jgi:hypothetical protein